MTLDNRIQVRVDDSFLDKLKAYRRAEDDLPAVGEAIRRVADIGLDAWAKGEVSPADASAAEAFRMRQAEDIIRRHAPAEAPVAEGEVRVPADWRLYPLNPPDGGGDDSTENFIRDDVVKAFMTAAFACAARDVRKTSVNVGPEFAKFLDTVVAGEAGPAADPMWNAYNHFWEDIIYRLESTGAGLAARQLDAKREKAAAKKAARAAAKAEAEKESA